MFLSYTGNGAYCYANSLHMSLLGAGANPKDLPDPGFLECLTGGPFGKLYLRLENGPLVLFSSPLSDPDLGLKRAIALLGWECEEWYGDESQEALSRLREAVQVAPALIGPVDQGYLSYYPDYHHASGYDHFVVALAIEDDHVLLQDPGGYPCAVLPIKNFLEAWRAERIGYGRGPYTLRSHFRQVCHLGRHEIIQQALPFLHEDIRANPSGPVAYGGVEALHLLANDLRGEVPASISTSLVQFVLPLASRRSLDAAAFLREAGKAEAAVLMERQALLVGQAQSMAVQQQWSAVVPVVEQLIHIEQQLVICL
ncbi:hypothetical protein [Ktedonobacter racemifer]|uniref:Butirosin biosynthesis protein H N-terminal domain-containing protein n=1 Tax=Ktedonobacter racemifer DSM 44963 TaxID=485913 RepID=D6TC86_KTERA|nr:hypothetical protein [Ktedonobacter racemifer]EFH88122.1 conserved hypothetical protein [Ktedonobacter racemifer DSM 44963]